MSITREEAKAGADAVTVRATNLVDTILLEITANGIQNDTHAWAVLMTSRMLQAAAPTAEGIAGEKDTSDRMIRINALIEELTGIRKQYGDTCVYIRRGGLSWGAVALNRESDDKEHGVFDLQAQHDRDMAARVGQVQRLIDDRNECRARAEAAEAREATLREALKAIGTYTHERGTKDAVLAALTTTGG